MGITGTEVVSEVRVWIGFPRKKVQGEKIEGGLGRSLVNTYKQVENLRRRRRTGSYTGRRGGPTGVLLHGNQSAEGGKMEEAVNSPECC